MFCSGTPKNKKIFQNQVSCVVCETLKSYPDNILYCIFVYFVFFLHTFFEMCGLALAHIFYFLHTFFCGSVYHPRSEHCKMTIHPNETTI